MFSNADEACSIQLKTILVFLFIKRGLLCNSTARPPRITNSPTETGKAERRRWLMPYLTRRPLMASLAGNTDEELLKKMSAEEM